ncbi:undecaprenyl-phosphate glucose phosphotransferase [Propionivibrio sp.]|uniref:undecaprenyl-phosphate glucose phosphotransferase n=1 Tax=Propionivibrio sp. TaxID=2212460 RepID=UPI0025EF7523|nr:undecaprenyl-phosphate glucose phosphotransferase [Propionivibrio sp.]
MQSAANIASMHSKARPIDRDNLLGAIEVFLDPVVLTLSLALLTLHFEGEFLPPYLLLAVLLFALTFPGTSQLQSPVWRLMLDITINWLWVAGLLLFLGFASRYLKVFSSELLITWFWVAPLSQFGAHLALRALAPLFLSMQGPPLRAIIVGMNEQGLALANRIAQNRYLLVDLCGFFDDRAAARLGDQGNFAILGRLEDLPGYVKKNYIQRIYLSLPMASQPRILQVLDELMDTTASIYFVPDMFITDLIQGRTGSVCGMPVISVCESPFAGSSGLLKRSSDIVLSLLILTLIIPLLLCIAIAVKLTSPGPVIFKQRRYGLDGKEILVYKFRTMTVCEDGNAIKQAQKNDSRFTPLGRFLRKTSMDELPQFINVLQGDMSIVGPRPHAIAHNEMYRKLIKGYMIRHKVKPGITGWAQVNGFRGETETLDKMQGRIDLDLDYLRNWSLSLDLQIIFKTILVVFKDQTAY